MKKKKNKVVVVPEDARILLDRFRLIRLKKGLSLNKVARRGGFEPGNYTKLEKGTTQPRLSTFLRMLRALDITWGYFGRFKG